MDELLCDIAGQPLPDRSLGERLRQQEDIGRAGAGHGGHGIQQRFVHHPDPSDRSENLRGQLEVLLAGVGTSSDPRHAFSDQSGCVRHRPDDGDFAKSTLRS